MFQTSQADTPILHWLRAAKRAAAVNTLPVLGLLGGALVVLTLAGLMTP